MLYYYIPYLYFLIATAASISTKHKLIPFIVFGLIFLIFFSGLRGAVDNDYESYEYFFSLIKPISESYAYTSRDEVVYFEPGFFYIISFLKEFLDGKFIFLSIATISIIIWGRIFLKNSKYPALSILIYICDAYYLREFTQIRFGLAVAIGFLSIIALKNDKKISYILYIFASFLNHYISIALLIIPLWIKIVKSKKDLYLASTAIFFFYFLGGFDYFLNFLMEVGIPDSRLAHYAQSEFDSKPVTAIYVSVHYLILMYVVFLAKTKDSTKYLYYESIYALSFVFLCVFSGFDILKRISFIFSPAIYLIIPNIAYNHKYLYLTPLILYFLFIFIFRLEILRPYFI